jgi:error-prone DNA polymerase
MSYAELHCLSNFSFQHGASSAAELFTRAKELGYSALAITDACSLAGIVRAYEASNESGVKLIVGAQIEVVEGLKLVILVQDASGYSALCALLTLGRRAAAKGEYTLHLQDVIRHASPAWCVLLCNALSVDEPHRNILLKVFAGRFWLAVELHRSGQDTTQLAALQALARQSQVPLVACGDVHMHQRSRRALQDVMVATRLSCSLQNAGHALFANGERHLRTLSDLQEIYPEELLLESLRIAALCNFDLRDLGYVYPHELVPPGQSADRHLRELTDAGAQWRWPQGATHKVRAQIEHELQLIAELKYEHFFLTVHDIVQYARSLGILCQGRGSAANSAVCYCLGITEVDPERSRLLFERFLSKERNEPPDIDVDFEHERREEVIQYIYQKYGRERAALAATVITYQAKSAVRDVGRALGLSLDQIELITSNLAWWDDLAALQVRLQSVGLDTESAVMRQLVHLVNELVDQPRHLSQHVGGFVISEHPLHTLVPVENAAMPGRTIIQWDKDDLETLGLLKVDCLALGMLSCIRRAFHLIEKHTSRLLTMASIPAEDSATYAMLQVADTVGVFQVESRAQMSMLPRLKPKNFFDLVIEVAIVRPGPIQGGMVHPYLRRRNGEEPVVYPSEAVRAVFERTLGVPIFQEQVMELVVVAAGFTPGEADQLRRSMAAWKRRGGLEHFQQKIVSGMRERGYDEAFALQIFEQIKGFGSYGFPESHASSFALLVYVSAWLKCHYPAAFACALLNAQPLGFYSSDQIIQDVRRHAVDVLPPDVCHSSIDSDLQGAALRLGLREIRGLSAAAMAGVVSARQVSPFKSIQDFSERCGLQRKDLAVLADAGSLRALSGNRHQARWAVDGVEAYLPLLDGVRTPDTEVNLLPPNLLEQMRSDYQSMGFTLDNHPFALIRDQLRARKVHSVAQVHAARHGSLHRVAGLVSLRQRPGTAGGAMFLTLEDETGWLNVVIWNREVEHYRHLILSQSILEIEGRFEHVEGVKHLIAARLYAHESVLTNQQFPSRDFH